MIQTREYMIQRAFKMSLLLLCFFLGIEKTVAVVLTPNFNTNNSNRLCHALCWTVRILSNNTVTFYSSIII